MTYEFNLDLSTDKFEIKIDTNSSYGYFEHNKLGDECGGGLWFEGKELIDYDGVFWLPENVGEALRLAGFEVSDNCM